MTSDSTRKAYDAALDVTGARQAAEIGREAMQGGFPAAPGAGNARPTPSLNSGDKQRNDLLRQSIAAQLASGMVAASGKPHTAAEMVSAMQEIMAELEATVWWKPDA